MPPKRKGAAAAASPAAKKKGPAPHPAKRLLAKKRRDEQAADATPTAAAEEEVSEFVLVATGEGGGAVDVKKEEQGSNDAHAVDQTEEAAAVTAETAVDVDVAASEAEVNGSVGDTEDTEVEETTDAAAEAVGECGVARAEMMAAVDAAAAAKGDIAAGLTAKEEAADVAPAKDMEVEEDEPGAGTLPSSRASAGADADAAPLPAASADAELPPASLLLQIGPPSLAISQSVDELRGLSTALSTFIRCWDRLSHHLDSIQASMGSLSGVPGAHRATEGKQRQEEMGREADERKNRDKGAGAVETERKGRGGAEQGEKPEQAQKGPPLDLDSICEKMLGRNLRRYVVAHMSEVDQLREEVPRALRLATNPAKLVLSCIGRFYLQGSKAYSDPNSPMVSVRRACILVLEFFLLSGCPLSGGVHLSSSSSDAANMDAEHMEATEGKEEPSPSVMEEAKVAALAWKNRLVAEGGIASASAVDALGLALFVASFGIPSEFDSEMMCDVFRLCNMKKKADILRQSPIIVEKLPDIIQDLVQKEKYIAAADLACGFGLQEKYPPLDLISSFLIKMNTDAKEERRGQSSVRSQQEATANQLAAFKSVVKCLEDHKLDSSSLASFKIEEKISKLEKDAAKFEKKLKDKSLKRKAEDELTIEVRGSAKRSAPTPAKGTYGSVPAQFKPTQDHLRPLPLYSGSSNTFSGLLDRSGMGDLAVLGSRGRLAVSTSLYTGSGYSAKNGILPSAESGASYRWHQEGTLGDNSGGHPYVGMGHSGQRGLVGPASMENLLQRPASPLAAGSRATSSNLYGFADSVIENELYYGRSVRGDVLSNPASRYR